MNQHRSRAPFIFCLLTALVTEPAFAQLESTSAALLRSSSRSAPVESLDSERYKIRAPEAQTEMDEEKPGTLIPSPVIKTKPVEQKAAIKPTKTQTQIAPAAPPSPPPAAVEVANPSVVNTPAPEPIPVTEQVRELILGGKDEEIEDYKKQIHPQDPRANLVSVQLAPGYFYTGSSSNYGFRKYNTQGPGLGLGMNLWLTPFFGLQARYFSSVSSSIRSATGVSPMDQQSLAAGFRFRKHFGSSRKSAQLIYGLDFIDNTQKISSDATSVIGHKSSGISVGVDAEIPTSISYAQTLGLEIQPRLNHRETSTGSEARSGSKNETNALSLSLGGQWTLDRKNQLFWKSTYRVERNLFEGTASTPDVQSGFTPTGVEVTNTTIYFLFGFRWGS